MTNDTTTKTTVSRAERIAIQMWERIRLTRLGSRHAEGVYMTREPKPGIVKIDKERYYVISSGEIRQFKQNETKLASSIRNTFHDLANLIRHNFDSVENQHNALFITLTYVDNMTDVDKLMKDFQQFMQRLKYAKKGHKLDYIAVMEPQERGAWHVHLMLKSDQPVLYVDNWTLSTLACDIETRKIICVGGIWGHGITEVKRLKSDDVGAYYVAYFTSLEAELVDPDSEASQYSVDMNGKRYKKGARLKFYPKYMKFYRCSQGINRPITENIQYRRVLADFGSPVESSTYKVEREGSSVNTIQTERFKK